MLFVETPVFTRLVTATLNDAEYAAFQQSLADRPDAGSLIGELPMIKSTCFTCFQRMAGRI